METIVEVKQLQKRFGKTNVLSDVNFTIQAGEILGYVGPNGAGKSTTIRILLGLIKASSGTAKIFGQDVWRDAVAIHKRIAYVPGDVYLWPNLTGGQIIDLLLKLHGQADYQKRDMLIKKFNFDPRKKARSYSKGNRQKVALIAALASDADLYIFDEPTSGLDPLMEAAFQDEVRTLKSNGKAILLSSHILSEVEKLCDKIAIIRDGEIVEYGSLAELQHLQRYLVRVETEQELAGLAKQQILHNAVITGTQATFQVDSDQFQNVLRLLLPYQIKKIESNPQTLEDLFLSQYETPTEQLSER